MFEGYDFNELIEKIAHQKVLIIGDVMIDTYLWGKIDRVSPEAPVPIISDIIEECRLGGAANVALNIKSMNAIPILCSVIGGDERGTQFLDLLEEQNLSDVGITIDEYRLTTQKTRVISGYKHLLRIDEEIGSSLSKRIQEDFIGLILNLIDMGGIDAIIFQDYDKGVITPEIISGVTKQAKKRNIPIMVDPKFRNFAAYTNTTIFKPNLKEFKKGLKLDNPKEDIDVFLKSGDEFRRKQKQEITMITLADKGILVLADGLQKHIPAITRKVTDVSGAGDTVISLSALCYAAGLQPEQIAAVANLAGGQVCEKSGVVPVNKEQLLEECKQHLLNT